MQLTVAAVGQRMPAWVQAGWQEYATPFSAGHVAGTEGNSAGKDGPKTLISRVLKSAEGEALLAAVPAGHRLIALDEKGKQWSTLELAQQMENWMREEHGVCFLVGGPDGLAEALPQAGAGYLVAQPPDTAPSAGSHRAG